ncbi:MAG: glycosyltransferase family 4 protein [Deltaproteobacteria bacterium]|jgi:glycosyltransferase involved in cell wall biosynthesis|nr:glycosyltransferase family 4 protein [Deltaproteobacteria bacterium]
MINFSPAQASGALGNLLGRFIPPSVMQSGDASSLYASSFHLATRMMQDIANRSSAIPAPVRNALLALPNQGLTKSAMRFLVPDAVTDHVSATLLQGRRLWADLEYRPQVLHSRTNSGTRELSIQPGVSLETALADNKPIRALFLSHFPIHTNGSGFYTKAITEQIAKVGGEVGILFAGHEFIEDPPEGMFRQYLLPFTPERASPLRGAARSNIPVFDSNSASPNGRRFMDLLPEELRAYAEGFADATAVAVRDMQPNIIVVNHAWVGALAAQRTGLPYVVVCHGSCSNHVIRAYPDGPSGDAHEPYPSNLGDIVFDAVRGANKVVTATDEVGDVLAAAYGVNPDKIGVIPHGFNKRIFCPTCDLDRNTAARTLGFEVNDWQHLVSFAGRMGDIKGVPDLIRAAQMVVDAMPGEVLFVLAGGGGKLDAYKTLAEKLGIAGSLRFIGHRSQSDLASLFRISDLVTVPSRSELFGITVLEAAGVGTPVLATNIGGLKMIVTEEMGSTVPPQNPRALADGIIRMLVQGTKLQIGTSAQETAHSKYGWDKTGMAFRGELIHAIGMHQDQPGLQGLAREHLFLVPGVGDIEPN